MKNRTEPKNKSEIESTNRKAKSKRKSNQVLLGINLNIKYWTTSTKRNRIPQLRHY